MHGDGEEDETGQGIELLHSFEGMWSKGVCRDVGWVMGEGKKGQGDVQVFIRSRSVNGFDQAVQFSAQA